MDWTWVGVLALFILAIAGIPVYIAILACAFIILVVGLGQDPIVPFVQMYGRLMSITLLPIPLFVFLGQILAYGGAGKPLINLMNAFMGHIPGGPAYALILANVVIAAMCASNVAAVAAFGPLIVPLMIGLGYSESFAVGLLICSSTLAPLIPPNIMAILYSYVASPLTTESVQVTTLWGACIIPGILLTFLLCVMVYIHARRGHFQRLPQANWAERWVALKEGWPVALTPVVVLGPLYADWATPTEVSAIGVLYVIFISLFFYRGLNLKTFWESSSTTLIILGAIFLIVGAATLLNTAFTLSQLPQDVTDWVSDMGLTWWSFMAVMIIIYIIMGAFLDSTAILLVSVPMLMATIAELNIDVIMFGVFTMLAVNLACITPPYGMIIFVSQSILGKPYAFIVRSLLLFLPVMILGMVLIAFIPGLSTWLPNYMNW